MALSHAILATLLSQPCSGYDLRKRFEGSVGFFWQASFQQIYRELKKLEDQGWVEAEAVQQDQRPDKKVYRVTQTGQTQLKDWIASPCAVAPLRDDLLVKMFAGHVAPKATILAELQHHRTQHLQRLGEYQQIQQQFFGNPDDLSWAATFEYLTLRQGIGYEAEWLAWCEEAIARLRAFPDPT